MFPEIDIKDDKDTKSNFKVIKKIQAHPGRLPRIKQGGNRLSTSVNGAPTGFHGDILIWDDLIDPRGSVSEKERQTAIHFLDHTFSQRKTDRRYSTTIGIMQRLHQNDPTAHLLESRDNIRHICLPGEIQTPKYHEQLKPKAWEKYYEGGVLDPVRLSWDILKQTEKELGTFGYAGQVGQHPIPPGGRMFKTDHFHSIDYINNPDANVVQVVRYWDKAGSEGQGAYTVGVKMAELTHGRYVVMDVKRGQWSSEEREAIIKETAMVDGKEVTIGIEQEPGSGGKESAEGTIKNLAGFYVIADRPTGDKTNRADQYSVQVNWGNVILLKGDWNKDYINELEYFPDSTYKDQVDASSGAFNMLTKEEWAGVW
jgi:predicted phage terminase large subunit-like protein